MKEQEIKLFNKKKAMFSRGTFTRCIECDYQALTWHSNLEELENCRKCGGKLEVIAKEVGDAKGKQDEEVNR